MHLALLSLFVSAVVCFTVPASQPDGVYMVTYNADGTETHSLLSRTTSNGTIPAAASHILTRSANAYNALGQQCGGGAEVLGGRDFYSIRGCTVAYFCNYRSIPDTCFQSEWVAVIQNAITPKCGSYWAGWDQFTSPQRQNQYGYENRGSTGETRRDG
ncbi:hypothetical protein DFH06DRAFT_1295781 [Mycena polygramma]|nr:hypothetical protein DFH06DRAFT_1295781 [Mycena polygramma]